MEDTLRYFFSAVFQGFAALIALGTMYYLHFREKVTRYEDMIYNDLKINISKQTSYDYNLLTDEAAYNFAVEHLKKHGREKTQFVNKIASLVTKLDDIDVKISKIKDAVPNIIANSLKILTVSLISLFLIGYLQFLDWILFFTAIYIIYKSIRYFGDLKAFISQTIELKL